MENVAHERDQINWACSAQNSELLPKPKGKVHKRKPSVAHVFDRYYAEYGNPRKKS